jgi:mismatch-specific thymine-DNA glycosylase
MARTRATAANTPMPDKQTDDNSSNDVRPESSSTFNGVLKQFEYAKSAAGPSSKTGKHTTAESKSSAKRRHDQLLNKGDNKRVVSLRGVPTPTKGHRTTSKYAAPSKYAHLSPLTDILEPNLICVFVGFNPGVMTATRGHAYAHPSNMFWKLLHSSGCTDRRLKPEEDVDLPRLYAMGNTNLVSRPTKDAAELSKQEQVASVPILDVKIRNFRPEAVCIVGKSIWENIWTYRYGKKPSKEEFRYGWQEERHNMGLLEVDGEDEVEGNGWPGARVFVATSTSGLSASLKPHEKEAIWKPFGEWVQQRREERKIKEGTGE